MRLILAILTASLLLSGARAQAPAGEREIATDAGFNIKVDWFDGAACADKDKARFYFRIGKQTFVVPASEFVGGQLRSIKKAVQAPDGKMTATIPRTAGCKSDPLALVTVGLKTGTVKPNSVQITETPERAEPEPPVTRYIKHLHQTGACKAIGPPNLLACGGSRTVGNQKVDIAFFVVTDPDNKISVAASGIPVHARCEGDAQRSVCFVSDEMQNGATAKSFLDMKGLTSDWAEEIRRFRQTILDFAAKRRAP